MANKPKPPDTPGDSGTVSNDQQPDVVESTPTVEEVTPTIDQQSDTVESTPDTIEVAAIQKSAIAKPMQATDKTVKGGLYIVDGNVVDANGKPVAGYTVVNGQAVMQEGNM